jgi:hypothetical protein
MHFAKIDKSDRLQRVYRSLRESPKTTRGLIRATGCCAINSIVSELRSNGIGIKCENIKRGVFRYSLERGDAIDNN